MFTPGVEERTRVIRQPESAKGPEAMVFTLLWALSAVAVLITMVVGIR